MKKYLSRRLMSIKRKNRMKKQVQKKKVTAMMRICQKVQVNQINKELMIVRKMTIQYNSILFFNIPQ